METGVEAVAAKTGIDTALVWGPEERAGTAALKLAAWGVAAVPGAADVLGVADMSGAGAGWRAWSAAAMACEGRS